MTIHELARATGYAPRTIHDLVYKHLIPPPSGYGRWARYGPQHLEALRAYQSLKHNNTVLKEVGAFLREEGITLVEYLRRREQSIKAHGLGVA